MSDPQEPRYKYPDKMRKLLLHGLEEVIGRSGLNALLNMAGLPQFTLNYSDDDLDLEFEDLSQILATLEKMYGPQGGHGVAQRVGRACFKYGMREFGAELGLTDMDFRLLPVDQKLLVQVERLAKLFNTQSDQHVRTQDQDNEILWHIDRCPMCWGRHTDSPVCHLAVGLLQEATYWVSGGKIFNVKETSCIAQGDPTCTILIEKQPFA